MICLRYWKQRSLIRSTTTANTSIRIGGKNVQKGFKSLSNKSIIICMCMYMCVSRGKYIYMPIHGIWIINYSYAHVYKKTFYIYTHKRTLLQAQVMNKLKGEVLMHCTEQIYLHNGNLSYSGFEKKFNFSLVSGDWML